MLQDINFSFFIFKRKYFAKKLEGALHEVPDLVSHLSSMPFQKTNKNSLYKRTLKTTIYHSISSLFWPFDFQVPHRTPTEVPPCTLRFHTCTRTSSACLGFSIPQQMTSPRRCSTSNWTISLDSCTCWVCSCSDYASSSFAADLTADDSSSLSVRRVSCSSTILLPIVFLFFRVPYDGVLVLGCTLGILPLYLESRWVVQCSEKGNRKCITHLPLNNLTCECNGTFGKKRKWNLTGKND